MSAFVGLLKLDVAPAPLSTGAAMLERLRHRVDAEGWDARHVRASGPIALGSAILNSTLQAHFEREHPDSALSLTTSDGKSLWFAGDVRLDSRDELARHLELPVEQSHNWSDSRLVLETYQRFGQETPRKLKGDFAFAIWDEARSTLFCARDRFGVRPFYFAFVPEKLLAFANEIKALWPALPFPPRPDEAHIADYLVGGFASFSRTFYEGIERLPPAHTLTLDLSGSAPPRQNVYFSLDGAHELHLDSDADYAHQLRAGFERSIRERAQCPSRLAVFLSGGLDSSSVAAVATRQTPPEKHPLLALSMVFARFKDCDERRWIEPNLASGAGLLEREWVWGDDIGALNSIERVVWHLDGPPPGVNTCSTWAQYAPLQKAGARVVLDGHGGDEVIFLGYERINELINARRFKDARHELLLLRRHGITKASATPLLWAHLSQKARGTRFIGRFMRALPSRSAPRPASKNSPRPLSEIEEGVAIVRQLVRAEKRPLLPSPSLPPEAASVREHHLHTLTTALQPLALEAMDAIAGAHALEVRAPFWEEELVKLCLSFPSDQKLRHGWNRWVMRRAMEGLLPPSVQWRRAKTNFAPQMIFGLRSVERARVEAQLDEPGMLENWVDIARTRELWAELQSLPLESVRAAQIAFALWRVLALGVWLQGFSSSEATSVSSGKTATKTI
ncbi:putative asparagine synthetase [glutamine-hydrolyzing] [Abditibacteriota bacterium]|nr:putative asparagine synthetase [glutamine-hydrolyzing] [Abditibacteriota bacterium]